MVFENKNKNPNELHDYLIENSCKPLYLMHNAIHDENGWKVKEATEIYVEIEDEKQQQLIELVNQFMAL